MPNGKVMGICIAPGAGKPMERVEMVEAVAGRGLKGDRYSFAEGSWNKGRAGHRQVTLINERFVSGSEFRFEETRRNILASGLELMWLIGREFRVGTVKMRGLKYCDPCGRPSQLIGGGNIFASVFFDCGGLVAEILDGGFLRVDDEIIPPTRSY